jgi:ankyrin repeat protein
MQAIEMSNELHRCLRFGILERVKQLVEGGANIEMSDEDGMTALILASLFDNFKIVVYLVEQGANVAHADDEGKTALHWAGLVGNLSSVKILLEHGARIADRDDMDMTAFL